MGLKAEVQLLPALSCVLAPQTCSQMWEMVAGKTWLPLNFSSHILIIPVQDCQSLHMYISKFRDCIDVRVPIVCDCKSGEAFTIRVLSVHTQLWGNCHAILLLLQFMVALAQVWGGRQFSRSKASNFPSPVSSASSKLPYRLESRCCTLSLRKWLRRHSTVLTGYGFTSKTLNRQQNAFGTCHWC